MFLALSLVNYQRQFVDQFTDALNAFAFSALTCWLGVRKSIPDEVLVWLYVWCQIIC